eukprot:Gb_36773 [translate_table: standard]
MEVVPGYWPRFGLGSGIPLLKLSVEDLGEMVYAWELPRVAGNAWNGESGRSIAIGSSCIWDKSIFLATGRPGDCMEMLLKCLRNPRYRFGIVTGLQLVCGRWSTYVEVAELFLQCEEGIFTYGKLQMQVNVLEEQKNIDELRFG